MQLIIHIVSNLFLDQYIKKVFIILEAKLLKFPSLFHFIILILLMNYLVNIC